MTDLSGVGSMMNGDVSGTNLFVGDGYCNSDFDDRSKILMTEIGHQYVNCQFQIDISLI